MRYSYLSLGNVLAWESEAARRGVSEVARSNRGFLRAYETAGSARALSPEWRAKREGFIARHMAQASNEPWFDAKGRPTRRHLALIMWAYSPQPSRLRRDNPVMGILTDSELRAAAKSNPVPKDPAKTLMKIRMSEMQCSLMENYFFDPVWVEETSLMGDPLFPGVMRGKTLEVFDRDLAFTMLTDRANQLDDEYEYLRRETGVNAFPEGRDWARYMRDAATTLASKILRGMEAKRNPVSRGGVTAKSNPSIRRALNAEEKAKGYELVRVLVRHAYPKNGNVGRATAYYEWELRRYGKRIISCSRAQDAISIIYEFPEDNPTKPKPPALPFHGGKCYACERPAVGLRDRRPEGGELEPACRRHADPSIRTYAACIYCDGPVRKGSVSIDGEWAHAKCHEEACR
ncbi:MAG: hypothetical protein WC565_04250 [Parcubacteria group bacterium]